MTIEMVEIARQYVAAGLSVIPLRHRSKEPAWPALQATTGATDNWVAGDDRAAWRTYTTRMPTDDELRIWFADSDCQIGIVGGAISGGLVRLDFEHTACLATWLALLADTPTLWHIAQMLPKVVTLKGYHVYFRMSDPPGHVLLSSHGSGGDLLVLSETQGEGCYCVAPPAQVYLPDFTTLGSYLWSEQSADYRAIPTLDTAIATRLLDAARFPGLWEQSLGGDGYERFVQASRTGLWFGDRLGAGRTVPASALAWDHVERLQHYLTFYAPLLEAIATAPPAPPSYGYDYAYEVGDDHDDWD